MLSPRTDLATFAEIDMRVGTVLGASPNVGARQPAYVLRIDFGPLGVKTSSAQITEQYTPADLVGMQVVAVVNFPPKTIAGVDSEVLVLASVGEAGTVLLTPTQPVPNGSRIA
ncbi:MAG: tRNA-binding protein [Bacteroidota bacterium]